MHAGGGDTIEASSMPAPRRYEESLSDKPMLYFHASTPIALRSVTVSATDGTIPEHWPLASALPNPPSVRWRDLRLDAHACEPGLLPRQDQRPCSDLPLGSACEASTLASARTRTALCVRTSGAAESFLFYRSTSRTFRPPLEVALDPQGAVVLRARGAAPIPGTVLVIRRVGAGSRIAIVAPPDAAPVTVTAAQEVAGARAAARAIGETMGAIGLDESEIDAFLRAWSETLFGAEPADGDLPADDERLSDRIDRDGVPAGVPALSVLSFVPPSAADGVARLAFDPPPRRIARALAVWQPIP